MQDCIFCDIISGKIPSTKVYEDDCVFAFRDIAPAAATHILVVPKNHLKDVSVICADNSEIVSKTYEAIARIAKSENLVSGYRVVSNVGEDAGQTVQHLHFHILGGEPLGRMTGI